MFNNLTNEIIYYSLIPFIVVALITFILIIIGKKKYDNYYKYNYAIKILLFILIAIVLPLIVGYTIWIYERFINRGLVSSNIIYMLLLAILVISLVVLLIITSIKLYNGLTKTKENDKEKEFH